jgi:dipeptidyl aminopeptidase/acylaminoacyl peptidase
MMRFLENVFSVYRTFKFRSTCSFGWLKSRLSTSTSNCLVDFQEAADLTEVRYFTNWWQKSGFLLICWGVWGDGMCLPPFKTKNSAVLNMLLCHQIIWASSKAIFFEPYSWPHSLIAHPTIKWIARVESLPSPTQVTVRYWNLIWSPTFGSGSSYFSVDSGHVGVPCWL